MRLRRSSAVQTNVSDVGSKPNVTHGPNHRLAHGRAPRRAAPLSCGPHVLSATRTDTATGNDQNSSAVPRSNPSDSASMPTATATIGASESVNSFTATVTSALTRGGRCDRPSRVLRTEGFGVVRTGGPPIDPP